MHTFIFGHASLATKFGLSILSGSISDRNPIEKRSLPERRVQSNARLKRSVRFSRTTAIKDSAMNTQRYAACSALIVALFYSFSSYAGVTDCGYVTISRIYVNGVRDDANYSNQLLIELATPCNGKSFAYL